MILPRNQMPAEVVAMTEEKTPATEQKPQPQKATSKKKKSTQKANNP